MFNFKEFINDIKSVIIIDKEKKTTPHETTPQGNNSPNTQARYCQYCGSELKANIASCPSCAAVNDVTKTPKSNTTMRHCPICGAPISIIADTCPKCGHPFVEKKKEPMGCCLLFAVIFFAIIAAVAVIMMGL